VTDRHIQLDGIAHTQRSLVRLFLTCNHAEKRRLPGPVRADDPDNAGRRYFKGQVFIKQVFAVGFGDAVGLNHQVAQPRPGRDVNFQFRHALDRVLGQQIQILPDARLTFRLAAMGGHPHPFQFALKRFLPLAFGFLFVPQPFLLLVQPGGVIAFPGNALPVIQLEDPLRDIVQENSDHA